MNNQFNDQGNMNGQYNGDLGLPINNIQERDGTYSNQTMNNVNNWSANNHNQSKNIKNNNSYTKTGIPKWVIVLCCLAGVFLLYYFIWPIFERDSADKYIRTMTLNDVSFKYNSYLWKESNVKSTVGNSNDMKSLEFYPYYVVFAYSKTNYYNSSIFVQALKSSYESSGVKILNNVGSDKVNINGIDWYIIKCDRDNKTYYQLVYVKEYNSYSLTYMVDSSSFDSGFSHFETIYKTLSYDTSADFNKQNDAKNQLIGEWDWGKLGYFVVTQDKIYLYKDSSKSMDNVYYGTYTVSDAIPNVGSGRIDGLYVVTNYTEGVVDGVSSAMTTPEREYSFIKYSDGSYKINDLISGASGTARKIK